MARAWHPKIFLAHRAVNFVTHRSCYLERRSFSLPGTDGDYKEAKAAPMVVAASTSAASATSTDAIRNALTELKIENLPFAASTRWNSRKAPLKGEYASRE